MRFTIREAARFGVFVVVLAFFVALAVIIVAAAITAI